MTGPRSHSQDRASYPSPQTHKEGDGGHGPRGSCPQMEAAGGINWVCPPNTPLRWAIIILILPRETDTAGESPKVTPRKGNRRGTLGPYRCPQMGSRGREVHLPCSPLYLAPPGLCPLGSEPPLGCPFPCTQLPPLRPHRVQAPSCPLTLAGCEDQGRLAEVPGALQGEPGGALPRPGRPGRWQWTHGVAARAAPSSGFSGARRCP